MTAADPEPDPVPMDQVMLRLSRHLSLLAERAKGLEGALGSLTEAAPWISSKMSKRLQDADFIRQSIDDLCMLTHLLANRSGDGPLSHRESAMIAEELQLCATRMLLDVGPFPATRPEDSQAPGELHLF